MIIVKLSGGMGNQMFQYAFGRFLANKYNTELKFDLNFLLDRTPRLNFVFRDYDLSIFNINRTEATFDEIKKLKHRLGDNMLDKILNKILGRKSTYLAEKSLNFNEDYLNVGENVYLDGYFQSEKYFAPISQIIKKDFRLVNSPKAIVSQLITKLRNQNSIAVNIRRTDFVTNNFHGTCDITYYQAAEKFIVERVENPVFYIFSDDLDWCKNNIKFSSEFHFMEHDSYAGNKFEDYLRLMSSCKHFIIPNSSFAWWAAYLSENDSKIVIVPSRWNSDPSFNIKSIILDNWKII